jgi:hypothetical protein
MCVPLVGSKSNKKKKGGGRGKGGEMTQTLFAHMNKRKKKTGLGRAQDVSDPSCSRYVLLEVLLKFRFFKIFFSGYLASSWHPLSAY